MKKKIKECLLGFSVILSSMLTYVSLLFSYILIEHDFNCVCATCEMLEKSIDNISRLCINCGFITAIFYFLTFELIYYFINEVKKND